MQLNLVPEPRTDLLARLHTGLIKAFGRIVRPPNQRRDPAWVLVHGVIGARTKTKVSNDNTNRLLKKFGSWEAVAALDVEVLTNQLVSQTYPQQSAKRLWSCLNTIIAQRGSVDLGHLDGLPTSFAMDWLESLPGVGRKISAGVMNTSVFDRLAIVLDGHHQRIMRRIGIVPRNASINQIFDELMPILPVTWSAADLDEHHLLMKKLGQTYCRPKLPRCSECFFRLDCLVGKKLETDARANRTEF
jgi:endonuclease-3